MKNNATVRAIRVLAAVLPLLLVACAPDVAAEREEARRLDRAVGTVPPSPAALYEPGSGIRLRYLDAITMDIGYDGEMILKEEGKYAKDQHGSYWVTRKVNVGGGTKIVFVLLGKASDQD